MSALTCPALSYSGCSKEVRYLRIAADDPLVVGLTRGASSVRINQQTRHILNTLKRIQMQVSVWGGKSGGGEGRGQERPRLTVELGLMHYDESTEGVSRHCGGTWRQWCQLYGCIEYAHTFNMPLTSMRTAVQSSNDEGDANKPLAIALAVATDVSRQLPFTVLPAVLSGWVAQVHESASGGFWGPGFGVAWGGQGLCSGAMRFCKT